MEVRNRLYVLYDVCPLQVSIERVYSVMESFWLVIKLTTKIAHPLDVVFSCPYVECVGVVQLAKALTFDKSVQNTVHRNFSLEFLTWTP
jgi:hypothetical protein